MGKVASPITARLSDWAYPSVEACCEKGRHPAAKDFGRSRIHKKSHEVWISPLRKRYRYNVPDVFSKKERSKIMAAIRSHGNKTTELRLVSILRAAGITGWRRHPSLLGHPDFIFRRQRLAVFVDGCFWHGCPRHCRMPRGNRQYWKSKIARNMARDRQVNRLLRSRGWRVLRIWGHALASPEKVASRMTSNLSVPHKRCNNAHRQK